jgi:hypothetical protein
VIGLISTGDNDCGDFWDLHIGIAVLGEFGFRPPSGGAKMPAGAVLRRAGGVPGVAGRRLSKAASIAADLQLTKQSVA